MFRRSSQFIFVIVSAICLASCATLYQPKGFMGGYSDFRINDDVFSVSFRGNGYTSSEKTLKYALLRCAEVTLQGGYKYFVIISNNDTSRNLINASTYGNANISTHSNQTLTGNANHYLNGSTIQASGNANSYTSGSTSSNTIIQNIHKPGMMLVIKCYSITPEDLFFDAAKIIEYNDPQ